jgi:hypothetical protein
VSAKVYELLDDDYEPMTYGYFATREAAERRWRQMEANGDVPGAGLRIDEHEVES